MQAVLYSLAEVLTIASGVFLAMMLRDLSRKFRDR